jgi:pimeloyl-ACP methyl ester carboxylesterase
VLVLAAEKDVIFPIERSQALAVALPSARLEVVSGAGHSIVVESPGPLAEALLRFFGSR